MWTKMWLQFWCFLRRPWRPAVVPADWGKPPRGSPPVYFWYGDDGHTVGCETSIHSAVDQANTQSLARGDWPAQAIVYSKPPFEAPKRTDSVVYGPCADCGFCTFKDADGRCLPCQAARNVFPHNPKKARQLSRGINIQNNPQWFGLTDEEVPERAQKFTKERRDVQDAAGPTLEGQEDVDDSCSA